MALWLGGTGKVLKAHHDDEQNGQETEFRQYHVQGRAVLDYDADEGGDGENAMNDEEVDLAEALQ